MPEGLPGPISLILCPGSLFWSIVQARSRIIKNRQKELSDGGTTPIVAVLSNFEANRASNLNSRVGSPDLARELESGTGTVSEDCCS